MEPLFKHRVLLRPSSFLCQNVRYYVRRKELRPHKQKPNRNPRMPLILTEKVHNLGSRGDLVHVKRGYGRNFLIPNGKAVYANHESCQEFGIADIKEQKTKKHVPALDVEKLTAYLKGKRIVIKQDEEAYKWAIHESHISLAFAKQLQLHIPVDCIELSSPLYKFGVTNIDVRLTEDDTAEMIAGVRISVPVEIVNKNLN